jgi:hypothetical protein
MHKQADSRFQVSEGLLSNNAPTGTPKKTGRLAYKASMSMLLVGNPNNLKM